MGSNRRLTPCQAARVLLELIAPAIIVSRNVSSEVASLKCEDRGASDAGRSILSSRRAITGPGAVAAGSALRYSA